MVESNRQDLKVMGSIFPQKSNKPFEVQDAEKDYAAKIYYPTTL